MMISKIIKFSLFFFLPALALANVSEDVPYIQIRIGHPTITLGPASNIIDNLFNSIKLNSGYLCFTANATSYRMTESNPLCKESTLTPVLGPIENGYAACGLWINDTAIDPINSRHLYAFAHAETDCNYKIGQTHKSMGIAQSFNSGQTWSLSGQIIAGTDSPTPGKITGEGDCSVIPDKDNYYYLYCLRNTDHKHIVARALQSSSLLSGTWFKYYNGTWASPGIKGKATALNASGTASLWAEKDYTMLLAPPRGNRGIVASFSENHINFVHLLDPLIISDSASWKRTPNATELIAYVSVIGNQGGRVWRNGQFILTYMYLEPGANFRNRYLVNRNVSLQLGETPNQSGELPQVGVELSRWIKASNTPPEIWTTTTATPGGFEYISKLGYLMTRKLTGSNAPQTVAIEECIGDWQENPDHVITPNGICIKNGYKRLRTLGWLYQIKQSNTTPLYRCWSPTKYKSHFASTDPNCEGEKTEFILGYILMS